jgi:hypothetical protein
MSDEFSKEVVGFWGALAAFFWSLPKILEWYRSHKNQKLETQLAEAITKGSEKMSEEQTVKLGIKNIQDCLIAGEKVSILLIKKFRDGIQLQDGIDIAGALLLDAEMREILMEAGKEIGEVPKEAKDLDLSEAVTLIKGAADSVERVIASTKA